MIIFQFSWIVTIIVWFIVINLGFWSIIVVYCWAESEHLVKEIIGGSAIVLILLICALLLLTYHGIIVWEGGPEVTYVGP